jgi:hypothetical protein
MRKLTIALGITALSLAGATQVGASPGDNPTCIDFVNFCDGLELSLGDDGHLTGFWVNTDCAGARSAISGHIEHDAVVATCDDFVSCPVGLIWSFKMTVSTKTFIMYGFDGVNPPFLNQVNQPYRPIAGACSLSGDKPGLPSSFRPSKP